jgi:hypothetical protein
VFEKKYSAKNPLTIKNLLSVTLGKGFAEYKIVPRNFALTISFLRDSKKRIARAIAALLQQNQSLFLRETAAAIT